MINRNEILIKRAESSKFNEMINFSDVDYERSEVTRYDDNDYVVLRNSSDILSVFIVDEWQVRELEPEYWPDHLLDEAEAIGA